MSNEIHTNGDVLHVDKRTVRNMPSLQKEISNIGWDINHLQLFVFLYQELKNMPIEDDVAKCDTITI